MAKRCLTVSRGSHYPLESNHRRTHKPVAHERIPTPITTSRATPGCGGYPPALASMLRDRRRITRNRIYLTWRARHGMESGAVSRNGNPQAPPAIAQPVVVPLTRAAIFLVVTVNQ